MSNGVINQDLFNDFWYDNATMRSTFSKADLQTTPGVDSSIGLTYDNAGNPTKIQDTTTNSGIDTQCFNRDGLGQLKAAWTPSDGNCAAAVGAATLGGPAPYRLEWVYSNATGNRTKQTDSSLRRPLSITTYIRLRVLRVRMLRRVWPGWAGRR